MKHIKYLIGVVIVVVIVVVLLKSDSSNRNKAGKQDTESAKKFQLALQVQELCSKYNAVTDWKQLIGTKDFGEHTYTIEIEDALIRTDSRPILFYGLANDIVRESDKYLVYWDRGMGALLRDSLFVVFGCDIHFVLDCTPNQVEQIIQRPAGYFDCYAVIAQISEVEKIRFELSSDKSGEKVHVKTSDVFMAKGRCLDLLFVAYEQKDQ